MVYSITGGTANGNLFSGAITGGSATIRIADATYQSGGGAASLLTLRLSGPGGYATVISPVPGTASLSSTSSVRRTISMSNRSTSSRAR